MERLAGLYDVTVIDAAQERWIFRCLANDEEHAAKCAFNEPNVRLVVRVRRLSETQIANLTWA
jgi:hypothetical protein